MIICYLYVLLHKAQMFVFMMYLCYLACWENLHDHLLSLCFFARGSKVGIYAVLMLLCMLGKSS